MSEEEHLVLLKDIVEMYFHNDDDWNTHYIDSIAEYRKRTNLGLKESKEVIDRLRRVKNPVFVLKPEMNNSEMNNSWKEYLKEKNAD